MGTGQFSDKIIEIVKNKQHFFKKRIKGDLSHRKKDICPPKKVFVTIRTSKPKIFDLLWAPVSFLIKLLKLSKINKISLKKRIKGDLSHRKKGDLSTKKSICDLGH